MSLLIRLEFIKKSVFHIMWFSMLAPPKLAAEWVPISCLYFNIQMECCLSLPNHFHLLKWSWGLKSCKKKKDKKKKEKKKERKKIYISVLNCFLGFIQTPNTLKVRNSFLLLVLIQHGNYLLSIQFLHP